jgi:hypothetical protein
MGSDHALENDREQATVRPCSGDSEATRRHVAGILERLIKALDELIHFGDLELEITMAEIEVDLLYGRD